MTPTTLLTIFGWLAAIYFVLCLFWDVQAWVVTSILYAKIPWREATAMLSLIVQSRIHYYLWSPIVPVAILFALLVAGITIPIVFTASLFLFWMHILLYQALPPSVLLLGTSRHETFTLRHDLERALHPYRVVVLIEPAAAVAATDSMFKRNLFEWDNLRTSDGSWRASVFGLLGRAPVIVIDVRVPTKGVVEEIRRVFSQQLIDKALFVANEDGSAPALTAARVQVQASSILSETSIGVTLKRSCLRHTTSPDDDPVLRRLGKR